MSIKCYLIIEEVHMAYPYATPYQKRKQVEEFELR